MRFDLAINVMTLHAVRKKKIFVLGGGNQWRPFVHVKDTARVFQLCLEKPLDRVGNQVFNVGGDHLNFQISELARRVQKLLPETEIEMIPDNPDPRSYRVGFDHIQTQLGFRPEISVEEGIAEIAGDVQRRGGTDFDDSRYYNIKRVKELETIPAKKGGEPLCSQVDLRPFALHDGDRQSLLALLDGGKEQALREVEAYLDRLREVTGLPYVLPVETEDALGELLVESVRGPRSKELALGPFAPTFLVRKLVRHKIRFRYLDLKPGGWRVDESRLKKAVGSGTSGVAVSNFFGLDSIPASSLLQLVRGEGLILEDLNHRIGSMFAGREIPKGKRIVGFLSDGRDPLKTDPSFVLSTNHLELYAKWLVLTSKRTTGISSSVHFVSPLDRELGGEFFFPVDPRKAFFERIKLHALTRFRDHRTALFSLIRDQLKSCEWVEVPEEPKPGDGSAYHYFPLRLAKRIDPARFADYLRHENVDVHLSWNGNPRLTNDRFGKSILHTLDFLKRSAAIPLYDQFTPRDAHNIAHSVRKVASWLIKESKV
jgi:dTDP-4-amino-4,6-dideoxygalactose transaminase